MCSNMTDVIKGELKLFILISAMQHVVISCNRIIYCQSFEHMKHKMLGKLQGDELEQNLWSINSDSIIHIKSEDIFCL